MTTLAERLGLADGTRALVISCDDLGFSYAANVGCYDALREGVATSASLMVPAPWARAAASSYRGEDVGVHLTLNAEHELYRWGPITQSPSLLDGDGGFPRTVDDVWDHADLDEVRREWRAQIERAVLWGFDISHLDAHLAGVELKPEFFDIYLDLAEDFQLPVRLPGVELERQIGFPFRSLTAERGVVAPDRVIAALTLGASAADITTALALLPDGVTELRLHPAIDTPELRAATPDWPARVAERDLVVHGGALAAAASDAGYTLISYRQLRQLMH